MIRGTLSVSREIIRYLRWLVYSTLSGSIALIILAKILDDFAVEGVVSVLAAAAGIAICQGIVWPRMFRFSSFLPALVFPLAMFLASALVIIAVGKLDDLLERDTFRIDGLDTAVWISLGMTIVVSFLSAAFSLDDRPSYDRMVTGPLRARYEPATVVTEPGFLFLEIDGLAEPILRAAIDAGFAPVMKRWLQEGSHRLIEWEPDLSSQTSASQAGILLGSNENIPAFRWWDKELGRLMVSSSMETARTLETRLASNKGLLAPDGSSRFNVFSGGAADCVGTFSRLDPLSRHSVYWAYFANPYSIGRLISRFFQHVAREWWEEFQQNRRNVLPRIARPWTYAFVRAGTTAALMELTRFMAIADIFRGVPAAYYTIFAYDEVAHHTGIDREYTLRVIASIDAMFGHLEDVAKTARRPMHLVVLSDHGQSQGATFRQRYGETLGDLVKRVLPGGAGVKAILDSSETMAHFRAVVAENQESHPRTARTVDRVLDRVPQTQSVPVGGVTSDAIVVASGNLGLISFPAWPERMTLQQIVEAFPHLIHTLTEHEGIGFVLVNDEIEGGMVLGKQGVYFLDADTWEGVNPLEPFGPRAAEHLRRTNSFAAAPDILVNSKFWQEENEVAAFEELVGSHGGLGGTQQRPFVLYPSTFAVPEREIVGAEHLNRILKGWIMSEQPTVSEHESSGSIASALTSSRVV